MVFVSVFIYFSFTSKGNGLFYGTTLDYSPADWDDSLDHIRNVPREDILNLDPPVTGTAFGQFISI